MSRQIEERVDERKILRDFVCRLLKSAGRDESFADDQSLFIKGLLDSIAAVELITFLEKNYGLQVDASFSILSLDSFQAILKAARVE